MVENEHTNDELYLCLERSIRILLFEIYKLVYDIAKKAESGYLFEFVPQASPLIFISSRYCDSGHDML